MGLKHKAYYDLAPLCLYNGRRAKLKVNRYAPLSHAFMTAGFQSDMHAVASIRFVDADPDAPYLVSN